MSDPFPPGTYQAYMTAKEGVPYRRGLYGIIGDRFDGGINTIAVIGDLLQDVDEFYRVVKHRDGYPVLELERTETRPGGAGAVAAMVQSLGVDCHLLCDRERVSVKRRIIVDWSDEIVQPERPDRGGASRNKDGDGDDGLNAVVKAHANILPTTVLGRIDCDVTGQPPKDLPPAALVLIADYAKGAITGETIARIERQYPGREIIADWHPSRPAEFYGLALLKSSWGPAFIRTQGADGLLCGGEWFRERANVVDPCGAGDMVLATLGVSRLRGLDWPLACQAAAENAAKVCGVWGARTTQDAAPNAFR